MAIYRVPLRYDRRFASPATWFWVDEIHTLRCRFRLPGEREELSPVDVHVYFRGEKRHGMVRVVPQADGTFVTGIVEVRPDLARVELLLQGAPDEVAASLLAL